MPLIVTRTPRTRQPQATALVSPDLGRNLEFLRLGTAGNIVAVRPSTLVGAPTKAPMTDGIADSGWSESTYISYLLPSSNGSGNWAIATVIRVPALPTTGSSANGWGVMGVCDGAGSSTADRALYISPGGLWRGYTYDGALQYADGPAVVAGKTVVMVVSCDGNILTLTSAAGEVSKPVNNAGFSGYSSAAFCVGNANDSAGDLQFDVSFVARWGRALTRDERGSIIGSPWKAMFAPIERRIWVPSASSAVPSITAVYADSVTASSVVPRVTLDFA